MALKENKAESVAGSIRSFTMRPFLSLNFSAAREAKKMAPETVNSNPLPITRGIAQVVQHEECPIEAEWRIVPVPVEIGAAGAIG